MDLEDYIKQCVFKVLKPNKRLFGKSSEYIIVGTGFWISSKGHCVTCNHVLQDHKLDFDSVDIEYQGKLLKVSICRELANPEKDISILKISDEHVPLLSIAPLGLPKKDTKVWSFGYRQDWPDGYSLNGPLGIKQIDEIFPFKTQMPGRSSVGGMSGSPVFDPEQNAVVGILIGEEKEGSAISYVNSMNNVFECWPELKSKNASTLISKLLGLDKATNEALKKEFIKLKIPYLEREADKYLHNELDKLTEVQFGFYGWVVIGEAGVGKSTLLSRLVEWCKDSELYFPIWFDRSYFYGEGKKLEQLLDCSPADWGSRLQDFAKLVQKRIVIFVDSLDVILSHTNAAKLVSQLNELAANSLLICSSRPSEYQRLEDAATPRLESVPLKRLSDNQVISVLEQAQDHYHLRLEDLHSKLIEMCQNPFILYLLLELSKEEPLPYIANPSDTWVRQKYWEQRVERIRSKAFVGNRFGNLSKEQVCSTKVIVAKKIADRMLQDQTYQLSHEILDNILKQTDIEDINGNKNSSSQALVKWAIYEELVAEGVIRVTSSISFLHDSFADFVMCKQIIDEQRHWQPKVKWILENINAPFYVPIVVRQVLQARDTKRSEIEGMIYDTMLETLKNKREDELMMSRSWGVTYALHQLAPVWVKRLCASLDSHCEQETASSIASVLQDVGNPDLVVPTLIDGMHYYKYKRRFIDGLGAYHNPQAIIALLDLLDRLLQTREDDELLETIALALAKIGDGRAQPLLAELEADESMPRPARREARNALWKITSLPEYSKSIPYTDEETIEGLRIRDKRDQSRYSDWKTVKQTAERILKEAKVGETISLDVAKALIRALEHDHEDAQYTVVEALAVLDNSELAVSTLEKKVFDNRTPDATRRRMVYSLTQIATRTTVELFKKRICDILSRVAYEDENPQVRQEANDALVTLDCPK